MKQARRLLRRAPMTQRRKVALAISARSWKPVRLVWWKAGKAVSSPAVRPRSEVVRSIWASHCTLHFNLATSFASRLRIAAPAPVQRAVLWSSSHAQLTLVRQLLHSFSELASRTVLERQLREAVSRSRIIRETSATELRRTLKWSELRWERNSATGGPRLIRTLRQTHSARPSPTPAAGLQSIGQVWRRPRRRSAELSFHGAAVSLKLASDPLQPPLRPPELVWRTVTETSDPERMERIAAALGSPAASGASSIAGHAEQSPAAAVVAQARMFDAALIDRVAEDVIGRVERRMRIERERRGV